MSVNSGSVLSMELIRAEILITGLMHDYGLTQQGWRFQWDRAKGRYGSAHGGTKTITLSRVLTPLRDEADVRMTSLHEVAHGIVGTEHQHNAVWRRQFVSMGGDGKRCSDGEVAEKVAKYVVICKYDGHVLGHCNRMLKNVPNRYCVQHRAGIIVALNPTNILR